MLDLSDPAFAEDIFNFCHLPDFVEDYYECRVNEGLSMAEFIDNYHMLQFMCYVDPDIKRVVFT